MKSPLMQTPLSVIFIHIVLICSNINTITFDSNMYTYRVENKERDIFVVVAFVKASLDN